MLDAAWKYCVYCGLATGAQPIPTAIRPWHENGEDPPDPRIGNRLSFIIVGTVCFMLGVALFAFALVVVLEYFK